MSFVPLYRILGTASMLVILILFYAAVHHFVPVNCYGSNQRLQILASGGHVKVHLPRGSWTPLVGPPESQRFGGQNWKGNGGGGLGWPLSSLKRFKRGHWPRWNDFYDFRSNYPGEYDAIWETALTRVSGPYVGLVDEKNEGPFKLFLKVFWLSSFGACHYQIQWFYLSLYFKLLINNTL
jgi:hypothetical protein